MTVTVKCHLLGVRGACRSVGSPLGRAQGGALGRWVVTSAVTCHPQGEVSLGPILYLVVWLFRDKCHPFIQPKFMIRGGGHRGLGDPQPGGRGLHAGMSLLCHVVMLCEGAEGSCSSCIGEAWSAPSPPGFSSLIRSSSRAHTSPSGRLRGARTQVCGVSSLPGPPHLSSPMFRRRARTPVLKSRGSRARGGLAVTVTGSGAEALTARPSRRAAPGAASPLVQR